MGFFANRRNRLLDQAITSLIASGRKEADFPNIYYDAARRYAEDNGGSFDREYPDVISFTKNYGGQDRFIMFSKMWRGGGTNIDHSEPLSLDDFLGSGSPEPEPAPAQTGKLRYYQLNGVANEDVFDAMLEKCVSENCLVRAQSIAPAYFILAYDDMRMSPHCRAIRHYGEKAIVSAGYITSQFGKLLLLTSVNSEESFMMVVRVDIPELQEEHKEMAEEKLAGQFAKWHELITDVPAPNH